MNAFKQGKGNNFVAPCSNLGKKSKPATSISIFPGLAKLNKSVGVKIAKHILLYSLIRECDRKREREGERERERERESEKRREKERNNEKEGFYLWAIVLRWR